MLLRNREILLGTLVGVAVFVADTFMDASNDSLTVATELRSHPVMVVYRFLFIVAGFVLGWLLWQKNKTAREFDRLQESLDQLRRECEKRAIILHASLQLLLTRTDFHLPAEAEQLVRRAYESSQEIHSLVR